MRKKGEPEATRGGGLGTSFTKFEKKSQNKEITLFFLFFKKVEVLFQSSSKPQRK